MRALLLIMARGLWLMLGLASPALAEAGTDPILLFTLPWDMAAGPSLDPGGEERLARGPSAVAVDPRGDIWILDTVGGRALVVDRRGRRLRTLTLPGPPAQMLAVADDGSLALLYAHLWRIDFLSSHGQVQASMPLSVHTALPSHLGFTPKGEIEIENHHGERFLLGRPGEARSWRAVLAQRRRGPLGSGVDCALQVKDGRVLLHWWRADRPVVPERPNRPEVIPLALAGVSSVRFLSACSWQGAMLQVERVAAGSPVAVQREVAKLAGFKVTDVWPCPEGTLYQPFRGAALQGETMVLMLPQPQGLAFWQWSLP